MIEKAEIKEKLFSESNVWGVIRTFESAFPIPLKAKYLASLTFAICAVLLIGYYHSSPSVDALQRMLRELVDYGFLASTALLGIAIAGFAIFASSLDPLIVERLATTKYRDSGPYNLSFIFAAFVYVLMSLLFVVFAVGAYFLLLSKNSLFFAQVVAANFSVEFTLVLLSSFAALFVSQLVFIGSTLVSFVWNLHQILMIVAAAKMIENQNPKADSLHE